MSPEADPPAPLRPQLRELLRDRARRCRRRVRRCRRAFSEKAVHDLRIESRRFLADLDLVAALTGELPVRPIRAILKERLDAFDDLRDVQVQRLRLAALGLRRDTTRRYRDWLKSREKELARKSARRTRQFKNGRLDRLVAELARLLKPPAPPAGRRDDLYAAGRALNAARTEVERRAAGIRTGDTRALHRTRIGLKRVRYMAETLRQFVPDIPAAELERLQVAQDALGTVQDWEVALAGLERFVRRHHEPADDAAVTRRALRQEHTRAVRTFLRQRARLLDLSFLSAVVNPGPGRA